MEYRKNIISMGEVKSFDLESREKNVAIIRKQSEIISFMKYGSARQKGQEMLWFTNQRQKFNIFFKRDAMSI